MLKEFRDFAMRGNVVDMAVGVIMGASFGKIVSSLVSDVIMPPIGKLTGNVDFSSLFINLSGTPYESLAAAKQAGAATINIGVWLMTVIDFTLVAFTIFLLIRAMNSVQKKPAPPSATTKECPYCISQVPLRARRCAHCTSELAAA
jgi:large conductance mechanosensitive channel